MNGSDIPPVVPSPIVPPFPIVPPPIPPSPAPVAPPSPAPQSSSKKLLFLLIPVAILLLALVIGGVYWYLSKNSAPSPIAIPTTTPSQTKTSPFESLNGEEAEPEATDETANWETYTNTKNSYSIKIPNEWEPDRGYPGGKYTDEQLQTSDSVSWLKGESRFMVQALSCASTTLQDCFKQVQIDADTMGGPYKSNKTTTTNSSLLGFNTLIARSSYTSLYEVNVRGIFFINKGKLWSLECQSLLSESNELEKEVDQILSTFEFLD